MKKFIIFFPLLLLFSCPKTTDKPGDDIPPVPDIPLTNLLINTSIHYQKMDGIGAACWTFPYASDLGWDWSKVKFVFDELDLHYIRIAPWFGFWEETNDNDNPEIINWAGFNPRNITTNHDLGLAKYAVSKGVEVELGIWGVGEWMLKSTDPHIIDTTLYDELGESIASYILYMHNNGVDIHITDIENEPNIDAGNLYESPENLRNAAIHIIDQLDRNGLTNVRLHAPNLATPDDTRAWGSVILGDNKVNSRIAAVSYHTWWVDQFSSYDDIRKFAEVNNKPVWATEVGYCALAEGCFGGKNFLKPETWGTAWDYALSFYRAIAWSRASRLYHWSLLGHDAVVSPTGQKLVSFWILKQFANFIPPESYYLDGDSGDSDILCMPFELPDGTWTAIVINQGEADKFVLPVHDVPFAISESVQTTRLGYYKILAKITNKNGDEGYLLPGQSVTSFRMQ